ncbi:acyl-CoA/acyl-ACP dehydrogenase [Saccharopolyspora sp. K220]|uniref:acyl-CoA dehydrogenase family protein n=1 Tax=Saccharopolyspora soli TaxID=2926618 RepID=UPI0027DF3DFB|nr:acyl-CoA dehydrogenase family protein [Saccharopolyspora soli]MCI2422513.1 acyl-CoA/acyl-ACP dehydrogenase [Saccharopolyspora soli]
MPVTGHSEKTNTILEAIRWRARHRVNAELMDQRRSLSPGWQSDCAAAGLLGLTIPEEYGGHGLTWTELVDVMHQLGATNCNDYVGLMVVNTLGPPPIIHFARETLKKEILPQLASGQALSTSAISEPDMGSYLAGIKTTARRLPDGSYLLNGEKKWISLGGDARYVNVIAQLLDEHNNRLGITGFLIDTAQKPGFIVGPEERTLGLRAVPQNTLTFENLHIPPEYLLGGEGEGLRAAKNAFQTGRLLLAAGISGAAKRALRIAQTFAQDRVVATGLLAENGQIQNMAADAIAAIQAVDMLVAHTAHRLDHGQNFDHLLFIAKAIGCEEMWRVIDDCVQILGARGFLDTNVVGQMFRDYRLFRIFEGSTHTVWGYQGAMLRKRPEEFLALVAEFDTSPEVHELISESAEFTRTDTPGGPSRHRHTNGVGQLAGWSVLAAITSDAARRGDAHAYTAAWCERQLRTCLQRARDALTVELPTVAEISATIHKFDDQIGDLTQQHPGERHQMDTLLLRH